MFKNINTNLKPKQISWKLNSFLLDLLLEYFNTSEFYKIISMFFQVDMK